MNRRPSAADKPGDPPDEHQLQHPAQTAMHHSPVIDPKHHGLSIRLDRHSPSRVPAIKRSRECDIKHRTEHDSTARGVRPLSHPSQTQLQSRIRQGPRHIELFSISKGQPRLSVASRRGQENLHGVCRRGFKARHHAPVEADRIWSLRIQRQV